MWSFGAQAPVLCRLGHPHTATSVFSFLISPLRCACSNCSHRVHDPVVQPLHLGPASSRNGRRQLYCPTERPLPDTATHSTTAADARCRIERTGRPESPFTAGGLGGGVRRGAFGHGYTAHHSMKVLVEHEHHRILSSVRLVMKGVGGEYTE